MSGNAVSSLVLRFSSPLCSPLPTTRSAETVPFPSIAANTADWSLCTCSAASDSRAIDSLPIRYATSRKPFGKRQEWWNVEQPWGEFSSELLNYDAYEPVKRKEDGSAISTFSLHTPEPNAAAKERNDKQIVATSLLISDHDDGLTMAESEAFARKHGHEAIIVPSYNFGATTIGIKRDDFIKFQQDNKRPNAGTITEESGREYLEATGKLLPAFARVATYHRHAPKRDADGILYYEFGTPPREKHRVIRPLAETIEFAAYMTGDTTRQQFNEGYKVAYVAALTSIGTTFDFATKDVARLYLVKSRKPGGPRIKTIHVPGTAFDFGPHLVQGIERAKVGKTSERSGPTQAYGGAAKLVEWQGRNLTAWAGKYAKKFDVESLFDSTPTEKRPRTGGGLLLECFLGEHSGGDGQTYCINGNGEKGFILHCSG